MENTGGDGHESNHPQSYYFEAIEISSNGENWDASNYLPNERGLVDLVISGTTTGGIEFTEMKQMPLPGSLGCANTEGSADGQNVDIGYYYEDFYSDDGKATTNQDCNKSRLHGAMAHLTHTVQLIQTRNTNMV